MRRYSDSEKYALLAVNKNKDNPFMKIYLAYAFLFEGKYEEAQDLFVRLLKDDTSENGQSVKENILLGLNSFEKAGITHPDVVKIKKLIDNQ
jgi:thioredoxin-like negative regulator of GroEL